MAAVVVTTVITIPFAVVVKVLAWVAPVGMTVVVKVSIIDVWVDEMAGFLPGVIIIVVLALALVASIPCFAFVLSVKAVDFALKLAMLTRL